MIYDIIMNLFTDSTKQTIESHQKHFFQNPGLYYLLLERISAGFYMEKKNAGTKRTLRSHHDIEREKLRHYLSSILSMDNDEANLGKKKIISSMILPTLITNIPFSTTTNLYTIYPKNHVKYHP